MVAKNREELEKERVPDSVERETRKLLRRFNVDNFKLEKFEDRYILWLENPIYGLDEKGDKNGWLEWELDHNGELIRTPMPWGFSV